MATLGVRDSAKLVRLGTGPGKDNSLVTNRLPGVVEGDGAVDLLPGQVERAIHQVTHQAPQPSIIGNCVEARALIIDLPSVKAKVDAKRYNGASCR